MSREQKFFDALKDIFVGAKVEGESGYINLMRIKSKYFEEGVFPKLQKDIDEALKPFPEFREELFDKLYTFFNRYFSESGSIYFSYTPIHQNVYEKVYTDDDDVILFWKTHMLYYVKTDRLFNSLPVEIDSVKFFFDVSTLEHKKASEKREIVYEFKEKRADGTIVFSVYYSEKGKKTKIDEILRACKKEGVKVTEDILLKAFRVFEKQSEVDYFINRNAKEFLKEQFNIWLYQYVFSGESEWTEKRIRQLQTLQNIAFKIIDFISQFEDELVKIWNKPKFVVNSNYVITLDRIADKNIQLVERILNHPKFGEQIKEWKELGIVSDVFNKNQILDNKLTGKELKKECQHLPIDTKYFKDIELEILGSFEDLDNVLDGWLIKSESYQALNTILPKFREKVQTIYADPPFNKEQDADYFYSVKYKDATWITLLENRLWLAKNILNNKGSIFVRCDYNGNMYVRLLLKHIFREENFRNEIILRKVNYQGTNVQGRFNPAHDLLYFCNKEKSESIFSVVFKERGREPRWVNAVSPKENKERNVIFISGRKFIAPKDHHWRFSQKKFDKLHGEGRIRIKDDYKYVDVFGNKQTGIPQYLESELTPLDSNWTDISGYSFGWKFPTENSEILLKRVIESTSNEEAIVMDFFLGSGTTIAVAHKLKRKWIGVEMGEHFHTIILPRMKKVLAGERSGISKEINWQGGGFFKYYELEQYEDALRRVKYEDSTFFENSYADPYNQYVFMRDLKMLETLEIDYENDKIKVDLAKLYPTIDIAETLSNLLGKWIKKITPEYVEFEDGEKINTKELDYKLIKPLIWW